MKIGLPVALQVVVIAVMIIVKLLVLADGREILVLIQPVDPRDPLRGDYVTYQHDLTTVMRYYGANETFREGQEVYVSLLEVTGFSQPVALSSKKPKSDIFIKGRITEITPDAYRLAYGIEQYFIPEGKGQMFNQWTSDRQAFAKIAVDTDGTPVLRQLYIDGKPWP